MSNNFLNGYLDNVVNNSALICIILCLTLYYVVFIDLIIIRGISFDFYQIMVKPKLN